MSNLQNTVRQLITERIAEFVSMNTWEKEREALPEIVVVPHELWCTGGNLFLQAGFDIPCIHLCKPDVWALDQAIEKALADSIERIVVYV
jgi:hypothetical protein